MSTTSNRNTIFFTGRVEPELLHTYSAYLGADILLLIVRLAVLMAVTLTVPVVIFPVSNFCYFILPPLFIFIISAANLTILVY